MIGVEWPVLYWGSRSPFFVFCQSLAISGKRTFRELVANTCLPAQKGQPEPRPVRLPGTAAINSESPSKASNQTTIELRESVTR